ncbi:MAG: ankyrin repeat domain-containing protein [Alphaproteobacteria bacterium]
MSLIANLMDAGSSNKETQFVGFTRMGDLKALQRLFNQNAAATAWKDYQGETALFVASTTHRYDIANWLLGLGADINEKNKKGNTPLMQAVHDYIDRDERLGRVKGVILHSRAANLEMIKFLILSGATLDAKDADGRTAADIAHARKIPEVADFMAAAVTLRAEKLENGCHEGAASPVAVRKPFSFK